MRKIYIVPNLVTTANLLSGFISVIASIQEDYSTAAWAILVAAIFDMLDGRIARLAKATSQFGVEYDSLSDLVSFGMAPAVLFYQWSLEPFGRLGILACFLYLCCAALRLARFNVTTSSLSKAFFQGIASPVAAGTVATFVIFHNAAQWPGDESFLTRDWMSFILAIGLGSLMISSIPFPSFKELNWRSRSSFGYLMIGVMAMVLIAVRPEITLFLVNISYILLSLIWNAYRYAVGRPVSQTARISTTTEGIQKK